ncbi:MAG: Hsp20/alpha crystallin family protein [Methanobacteriota archaeon]
MQTEDSKNIKPLKETQPVTTIFDEEKFFRIITELPGIAEEKIKIEIAHYSHTVTITASNPLIQFKNTVLIPCDVRFSKKQFLDGFLEIILEKLPSDNL